LGSLIALFERTVGYYGAMLGINAYHQPGVEAGKKAAGSVLELQGKLIALLENVGERAVKDIAKEMDASASSIYDILDRLCRCGRFGLTKNTDGAKGIADVKFRVD
jgi:glucose-6-phosphate isomerase